MKRFGREIALLTLPVLIFGGVALWKTRGGSMESLQGAPSDIYSGKPRLEIGEIKPLEMTPWDVAQGYVWGFDAKIWQGGQSPVASGIKPAVISRSCDAHIFYRRGNHWIENISPDKWSLIRQSNEQEQRFNDFALQDTIRLRVRLDGVPREAEEVRLHGHFFTQTHYQSGGCHGVMPGPGWKIYNNGVCYLTTKSKAFDIPIVKPKGEWPNRNVSRETALEFVDAKLLVYSQLEDFILQVRRKDGGDWTNKMSLTDQNRELLDAEGRPVELFDSSTGKKSALSSLGSISNNQDMFSPKRAKSDHFISFVPRSLAPKNGWSSVKFPLTYRTEISDGTCWPLKIDTKVERVQMRTEDFGAAK